MNDTLDGGAIYNKKNVSLHGNLDQIFSRIAASLDEMIIDICRNNPIPVEQEGEPTIFKRLTHKDNEILESLSLDKIYDHIRMVDGDEYQRAYINFGDYRLEFSNADFKDSEILAKVRFSKKK